MRNLFIILILALVSCQIKAQQTETRQLSEFTSIYSSESIRVTLKPGDEPRAEVSTDGDLEDVITEVNKGDLRIEMKDNSNFSFSNDEVEVIVYYQELDYIRASSSSRLMSDGVIKGDNVKIKGSSSARIDLTVDAVNVEIDGSSSARISVSANANNVEVDVSSSCRVNLSGESDNFDGEVSSSGRISAEDFTCSKAEVSASSSGRVELNVKEELVAKASSSGRITYGGKPAIVDANSSSGGKVSKM